MICPNCQANLVKQNRAGDVLLRNRAMVFKADGIALVCPKCKHDVPMSNEAMHAMHRVAVLFFVIMSAPSKS